MVKGGEAQSLFMYHGKPGTRSCMINQDMVLTMLNPLYLSILFCCIVCWSRNLWF